MISNFVPASFVSSRSSSMCTRQFRTPHIPANMWVNLRRALLPVEAVALALDCLLPPNTMNSLPPQAPPPPPPAALLPRPMLAPQSGARASRRSTRRAATATRARPCPSIPRQSGLLQGLVGWPPRVRTASTPQQRQQTDQILAAVTPTYSAARTRPSRTMQLVQVHVWRLTHHTLAATLTAFCAARAR